MKLLRLTLFVISLIQVCLYMGCAVGVSWAGVCVVSGYFIYRFGV